MKDLYDVYLMKDADFARVSLIDNPNHESSGCGCWCCDYLNHYCGLLFYCIY